ncbi:MAG: hypothetical protein ACFFDN_17865 [Candidatus Hodarchaeota archaeon]
MKEIPISDERDGINLFERLIRVFPFSIDIVEKELDYYCNNSDLSNQLAYWLWFSFVFNELNRQGYKINLEQYDHYDIHDYKRLMKRITDKMIICLKNINKNPLNQSYYANHDFLTLRCFFKALYQYILDFQNIFNKFGWNGIIYNKNQYLKKRYEHLYFNMKPEFIENYFLKINEFQETVNKILKKLGYSQFSLSYDGILRHFEVTAEAEEKKRAYKLLNEKDYGNVIEALDAIDDLINSDMEKKHNIGLANCRVALESFFKKLLLNHKIKKLHDGKTETDKGTINPLAQTVRINITNIFEFPKYSKNMNQGFESLLEASKFIVSGLADEGGSHGKSESPEVKLKEVKAIESFIILLINLLLSFEK